jgi:glycerophosphoryl diester phosphodiesterase
MSQTSSTATSMEEQDIKLKPGHFVAHRGQLRNYPENSIAALTAAADAGARGIEVDVQLSADRVPVLYHDADMRRISGQDGDIYQQQYQTLLKTAAHEPARLGNLFHDTCIAPLSDLTTFLQAHPRMNCFVEMKPHSVKYFGANACWTALSQVLAPVLPQCVFISFSEEFLIEVKVLSSCRTGRIVTAPEQLHKLKKKVDLAFCDINLLPADFDLRKVPVPVIVYEVSTPQEARHWLARGASLVETHDIAGMLQEGN